MGLYLQSDIILHLDLYRNTVTCDVISHHILRICVNGADAMYRVKNIYTVWQLSDTPNTRIETLRPISILEPITSKQSTEQSA